MKIERFDCGTHYDGGVMLDSDDGEYVYHKDYAELEAKCAALAAENAVLKSAAEFATVPDMWIEQAEGMLDYRYVDWYVDVLKAAMETPATDAYLAEVRAQIRNELIDELESRFTELSLSETLSPELKSGAAGAAGLVSTFRREPDNEFAAQLRQGGEHE